MKRVILVVGLAIIIPSAFLACLIVALAFYHKTYLAKVHFLGRSNTVVYAALPTSQNIVSASIEAQDGRTERIREFLKKYNSPLEPNSQDIVDAADMYDIDYRLIPAIAMQESNLCLKIPSDSYNCWGFGIYGGKVHKFNDYKEGIYTVTKTLGTKYKNNGLVTPEQIMTIWTPSSSGSWAFSVNHFMDMLK